jgi:hypothetical protein
MAPLPPVEPQGVPPPHIDGAHLPERRQTDKKIVGIAKMTFSFYSTVARVTTRFFKWIHQGALALVQGVYTLFFRHEIQVARLRLMALTGNIGAHLLENKKIPREQLVEMRSLSQRFSFLPEFQEKYDLAVSLIDHEVERGQKIAFFTDRRVALAFPVPFLNFLKELKVGELSPAKLKEMDQLLPELAKKLSENDLIELLKVIVPLHTNLFKETAYQWDGRLEQLETFISFGKTLEKLSVKRDEKLVEKINDLRAVCARQVELKFGQDSVQGPFFIDFFNGALIYRPFIKDPATHLDYRGYITIVLATWPLTADVNPVYSHYLIEEVTKPELNDILLEDPELKTFIEAYRLIPREPFEIYLNSIGYSDPRLEYNFILDTNRSIYFYANLSGDENKTTFLNFKDPVLHVNAFADLGWESLGPNLNGMVRGLSQAWDAIFTIRYSLIDRIKNRQINFQQKNLQMDETRATSIPNYSIIEDAEGNFNQMIISIQGTFDVRNPEENETDLYLIGILGTQFDGKKIREGRSAQESIISSYLTPTFQVSRIELLEKIGSEKEAFGPDGRSLSPLSRRYIVEKFLAQMGENAMALNLKRVLKLSGKAENVDKATSISEREKALKWDFMTAQRKAELQQEIVELN